MLENWRKKRAIESLKNSDYTVCRNEDIIRLREAFTNALTNDEELVWLLAKQLSYLQRKGRRVIAVLISSKALDRLVKQVKDADNPVMTNASFQDTLNFMIVNNGQVATLIRLPVYIMDKMDIPLYVIASISKFE